MLGSDQLTLGVPREGAATPPVHLQEKHLPFAAITIIGSLGFVQERAGRALTTRYAKTSSVGLASLAL